MKNERIIEMIDEHLTEPHSLGAEWVEALTICKQALIDNKSITEIFDKGVKYKEECEKKNTEIDILIRKNETLKDEVEKLKKNLVEAHIDIKEHFETFKMEQEEEIKNAKSEAYKEFAKRFEKNIKDIRVTLGQTWEIQNALKKTLKELTDYKNDFKE